MSQNNFFQSTADLAKFHQNDAKLTLLCYLSSKLETAPRVSSFLVIFLASNTKSVPLILAESTTLNLFHWNRSDEMMMIVLEASETKLSRQ